MIPETGRIVVLLAAVAALAGCSSVGNMFGSSSPDAGTAAAPGATAQASSAPAAPPDFECPSVEIRSGASTLTISAPPPRGGDPAALDLRYQGSIVRTARECIVNAGIVNLKVGVEGRIITGPAGGAGQVDIPIRIAVVEEGTNPKTVATKLYRTVVVIPENQGHSGFSIVADDLSFPMPGAAAIDRYIIYLGFDPQPEPRGRPAPRKPRARS